MVQLCSSPELAPGLPQSQPRNDFIIILLHHQNTQRERDQAPQYQAEAFAFNVRPCGCDTDRQHLVSDFSNCYCNDKTLVTHKVKSVDVVRLRNKRDPDRPFPLSSLTLPLVSSDREMNTQIENAKCVQSKR